MNVGPLKLGRVGGNVGRPRGRFGYSWGSGGIGVSKTFYTALRVRVCIFVSSSVSVRCFEFGKAFKLQFGSPQNFLVFGWLSRSGNGGTCLPFAYSRSFHRLMEIFFFALLAYTTLSSNTQRNILLSLFIFSQSSNCSLIEACSWVPILPFFPGSLVGFEKGRECRTQQMEQDVN